MNKFIVNSIFSQQTKVMSSDNHSSDNHDTKPTIETVLERIDQLGTRLETRIGTLENAVTELLDEVHRGFRDIERRLEVVGGEMLKIRGDMRYVHDRIDKIEKVS